MASVLVATEDAAIGPAARSDGRVPRQTMKHALHTPWFFCAAHRQRNGTLSDRRALPAFAYVEDYWAQMARLVRPSRMQFGSTLYLFRSGLEPRWEEFPTGGSWALSCDSTSAELDECWHGLVLAVIGEQLHMEHTDAARRGGEQQQWREQSTAPMPEEILGCELSVRQSHAKLAVWTRTARDEAAQRAIAQRLSEALALTRHDGLRDCVLTYVPHDAKRRAARGRRSGDAAALQAEPEALYVHEPSHNSSSTSAELPDVSKDACERGVEVT